MQVQTYCGGMVETNGYLVREKDCAFVVDAPEGMASWVEEKCAHHSIRLVGLFLTHGHWDHIVDAKQIQQKFHVPVFIHRDSAPLLTNPSIQVAFNPFYKIEGCKPDRVIDQENEIAQEGFTIRLFHCPGHCPGSLCYYLDREKLLFGGDVLFAGGVGRWDLPSGSQEILFAGIAQNLLVLADDTQVFPGHGPNTTIGQERRTNPYLMELVKKL